MDEDIEAVWIDRESYSINGSLFDDLTELMSGVAEIANDPDSTGVAEAGTGARVIIVEPSVRLLAMADYLPTGTRLLEAGRGRRLVLGAPFCDENLITAGASKDAAEYFLAGLKLFLGDNDGVFEIRMAHPASFEDGELIDSELWLGRAQATAGIPLD